MGVCDAPAWMLAAWRRSLQDVGATADRPTLEAYGERMIERWSAPERIHHNLRRLIAVLARVDELAPETHNPDVVRLAAWYHGAVFNAAAQHAYAHRGGVDEPASAELARTELTELGVPPAVVDRIAALILGIARHTAPKGDIDAQALCDADLGGLAAEPQRYAGYRKEVRAEYAHIPREDYVRARLAIVTKLLGRAYLFQSPMAQDWEDAARENLTAELDRLTAEAARLTAEGTEASGAGPTDRSAPDPGASVPSPGASASSPGMSVPSPGTPEQAGDGAAPAGTVAAPTAGDAQVADDGAAPVSPPVPGAGVASTPAVPDEVELPDGGPGPSGFEPRAVEDPGAVERRTRAAEGSPGAERDAGTGDAEGPENFDGAGGIEGAGGIDGASIESAPVDGRAARRASAAEDRTAADSGASPTETVAERSQRRWAEHLAREAADQEAAQRAGRTAGHVHRRGTSAPSPLEPGVGDTGANEGVPGASDDFDETSSLSRPPRMPAIKRRTSGPDRSPEGARSPEDT
ncbi:hypothetical protein [Ruania zhangjianzhongii]|uniref:hypothetical protein n=1 Tax=Ruania zhangjianzhongii TaxID=2603206 RepID=UPI001651E72A|nr:hypothetical protein [Ruania zhangjianzhongii]